MPDISEVSAAALAFIRAIRKLEQSSIVASVFDAEKLSDWLLLDITESVTFDEHEDFPFVGYDIFSALLNAEKPSWLAAIKRDEVDASLTKQTLDLANMVQGILGAKS